MAKMKRNKKAKLSEIPVKKKLGAKVKTKKRPRVTKPDSDSESESDKLPRLLEPYTKDQLVSLIVDTAVNSPALCGYIREVVDRDVTHRKIFVHGLPWDATRQTLVSVFEPFGQIEDCNVVTDRATGKTKGYGFVLFKTRKGAYKALREPQKKIGNRMASCQLACLGSAAKEPNAAAAAVAKKNEGAVAPKVKNQGQLPVPQGPVQPLQPEVLAAVAAAQNLNLFAQHPSLNPVYNGLLVSPAPAGYISPAMAGALNNSSLGLGNGGFGQAMPATSRLSSRTGESSLLGPYRTYSSSISAASQQAQASASQIGQQLISSRNKGAAGGSVSGYTSYLWYEVFLLHSTDIVFIAVRTVKCSSDIEIFVSLLNIGRLMLHIVLLILIRYSPAHLKRKISYV